MRKGQFAEQILTRKAMTEFKKLYPEYKEMKWEEFRKYWLDIAETIRQEAIENPLGVKLGSYTGELKLQHLRKEFKTTNYNLSEKLSRKVDNLNIVAKGKVGIIKWERRWAVKFNRMLQFFAFSPTRELNRMARDRVDKSPETIREARLTIGGFSIWRQIKDKL